MNESMPLPKALRLISTIALLLLSAASAHARAPIQLTSQDSHLDFGTWDATRIGTSECRNFQQYSEIQPERRAHGNNAR